MHRSRRHPERQLHQSRGTIRAESSLRLLFSPPLRRPVVSEHRNAGAAAGAADRGSLRCARLKARTARVASVLSSLRYLLAHFIGDDDAAPPFLPDGLPEGATSVVSEGIHRLIDYQGPSYAQLYVDRVRRFVGQPGVDDAMLGEIARLMSGRKSYQDPIRIARLKLAEFETGAGTPRVRPADEIAKFRLDELIGALPKAGAQPMLDALEWVGWTHKPVSIRCSTRSRWGIRRLKIEAGLRRWRLFSVRYVKERAWVERWLHMIGRSLVKQPKAAPP